MVKLDIYGFMMRSGTIIINVSMKFLRIFFVRNIAFITKMTAACNILLRFTPNLSIVQGMTVAFVLLHKS